MLNFVHLLLITFVFIPSLSIAMTAKLRTSSQSRSAGRIELFFKGPAELKERVRFLRSNGITSFNLVNKDKKDTMEKWVNSIREVYPEANISAHYSLKHNKVPRKGIEAHCGLLLKNLKRSKADEILLVSGGGDKKAWNTVEALKSVQRATNSALTAKTTSFPKLAVAYNPYFPSREDQEVEDLRLKEKIATGCVSKIYLQFGTDMDCLKRGLDFIRNNAGTDVAIAGSLFLPTKKLIAQQKFRPWNGVFLSSNFLNGPEEATAIILEMMKVYKANNVEMLWEAPGIRTDNDMGIVRELFNDAGLSCVFEDCDENNNGNANSKGASIKRTPACETKSVKSNTTASKRLKQSAIQ